MRRIILTIAFCVLVLPSLTHASVSEDIARGDVGSTVQKLQTFLKEKGYSIPKKEKGVFGVATERALGQFQLSHSETGGMTGTLNAQTRSVINNLLAQKGMVLGSTIEAPFLTNLELSMISPDVRRLQKFLNAQGYTVAISGPGSVGQETDKFGPATLLALKRYQEAYATAILTPAGLVRGTGMFYGSTRAYVNSKRGDVPVSPVDASILFTRDLARGSSGGDVIRLQELLRAKLLFSGESSGYFGLVTFGAVQAYQRTKNITVSGSVDSVTRAALNQDSVILNPILAQSPTSTGPVVLPVKNSLSPTIALNATPSYVYPGQSTVIEWTSKRTASCAVSNGKTGLQGSFTTSALTEKTTFSVTCTGVNGQTETKAVVVRVRVAPPQTLAVSLVGNGSVFSSPTGIECGSDCAQGYSTGTVVTLTAKPQNGSVLESWSGACTGSASTCVITMKGSKNVIAIIFF